MVSAVQSLRFRNGNEKGRQRQNKQEGVQAKKSEKGTQRGAEETVSYFCASRR